LNLSRAKNAVLIILLVLSFVVLLPLSLRFNPFFTFPFHSEWDHSVLLVWPDHVEMRPFNDLSEISPRPKGAGYTFNVAPERQAWVEKAVRGTPSPNGDAAWTIHIRQLGSSRQQIQLELLGDGVAGMIYEARPDEIVPIRSRLAGPGGAVFILLVNVLVWSGCWLVIWFISRLVMQRCRQQSSVL